MGRKTFGNDVCVLRLPRRVRRLYHTEASLIRSNLNEVGQTSADSPLALTSAVSRCRWHRLQLPQKTVNSNLRRSETPTQLSVSNTHGGCIDRGHFGDSVTRGGRERLTRKTQTKMVCVRRQQGLADRPYVPRRLASYLLSVASIAPRKLGKGE